MKIIYKENPLESIVELDDNEIEIFKLKIMIEEYESQLFATRYYLSEKNFNLKNAREEVNYQRNIDELLEMYISELRDSHAGDCVCFPCSCGKCYAEDILGINTIEGLGKHQASCIQHAYSEYDNIDDVLDCLENWKFERDPKLWPEESVYNEYLPRWKQEAKEAAEWLKQYKKIYEGQNAKD